MSLKRLSGCILLLAFGVAARAGSCFIYLGDTSKLFYGVNNQIFTPDKERLIYFQKGNIIFTGEADRKDNIFLMASSLDISSDKLEFLYEKNSQKPQYSFSGNKFYFGTNETPDFKNKNELLHIEQKKKWLAFYSSINDSLLAYYNNDSLPSSAAIVVAYTLIKMYHLDSAVNTRQAEIPFEEDNSFATFKPRNGNSTENEWMWDGKILRPRWNVDQRLQWTFDGQTVKPAFGNNLYAEYSWDGENLKPVWRTNQKEEWSWDGRVMKPTYGTDWANEYIIEDGIVKPWSNVHPEREWELHGDIPVPLLMLILSGIARPF